MLQPLVGVGCVDKHRNYTLFKILIQRFTTKKLQGQRGCWVSRNKKSFRKNPYSDKSPPFFLLVYVVAWLERIVK